MIYLQWCPQNHGDLEDSPEQGPAVPQLGEDQPRVAADEDVDHPADQDHKPLPRPGLKQEQSEDVQLFVGQPVPLLRGVAGQLPAELGQLHPHPEEEQWRELPARGGGRGRHHGPDQQTQGRHQSYQKIKVFGC